MSAVPLPAPLRHPSKGARQRSPLRWRFNLILAAAFVVSLVGSAIYIDGQAQRLATEAVESEARLHQQMALAVRQYTVAHRRPQDVSGAAFEPESVPAFAARETLDLLFKSYPGYRYREAALNPTNPKDQASDWEAALIERYRNGSADGEQILVTDGEAGRQLHIVRPIRIGDVACLRCHGLPAEAPPAMRQLYPDARGFGWRLGETVGAQIVSVPFEMQVRRAQEAKRNFLVVLVSVFALLFVTLNILLGRMVLRPLAAANRTLNRLADTDALTGISNRRAFDAALDIAVTDAAAMHTPLTLLVLDVDHFKRINDRFGHAAGDEVLRSLAVALRQRLRSADVLARIGGEEFAILLPCTPAYAAQQLAEMLRESVACHDFGRLGTVTASFGIALWDGREAPRALLHRADRALYEAKGAGRNAVAMA